MQQNNGPGFFKPGVFKVAGSNETFRGGPQRIDLGPGEVKYFDGSGRELKQIVSKEPPQPTAEQLFYNNTWVKQ